MKMGLEQGRIGQLRKGRRGEEAKGEEQEGFEVVFHFALDDAGLKAKINKFLFHGVRWFEAFPLGFDRVGVWWDMFQ